MLPGETVIKIASGGDHLLCLTEKGEIYSCGKLIAQQKFNLLTKIQKIELSCELKISTQTF